MTHYSEKQAVLINDLSCFLEELEEVFTDSLLNYKDVVINNWDDSNSDDFSLMNLVGAELNLDSPEKIAYDQFKSALLDLLSYQSMKSDDQSFNDRD